jgi:hypothetical protein
MATLSFVSELVARVDAAEQLSFEYHVPRHQVRDLPRDASTVVEAYTVRARAGVCRVPLYRVDVLVLPGYAEGSCVLSRQALHALLARQVGDCPRFEYCLDDATHACPL